MSSDGQSDVNDVLSSIRKLVSEEARARVEQAQQKVTTSTHSDPLMLKPTQEVAVASKPLVLNEPATNASFDNITTDLDAEVAPFQDEVALRKMVGEIIREELQGELGERITRNVRKLIRHEIEASIKAKD